MARLEVTRQAPCMTLNFAQARRQPFVTRRLFSANDLGRFAGDQSQPACLEVVALTNPRRRPAPPADPLRSVAQNAYSVVRVRARSLRDGGIWKPVDGRATPDSAAGGQMPHTLKSVRRVRNGS